MNEIKQISAHIVGNKNRHEYLVKSKTNIELNEDLIPILDEFFASAFKLDKEIYQFFHSGDLNLNEAFTYIKHIFENPESLHEQSINLAQHLFEQSTHPKIKGGEFFTVYFDNCNYKGETVEAIGLFKSENKETFLNIKNDNHFFDLLYNEGIHLGKLDKACIIYNINDDDGFRISVTDKTNKGIEAQYWVDDFLQIKQVEDAYFSTESTMSVFKNYIAEQFPEEFEANGVDKADYLNKTMEFFKNKESFSSDEFDKEVLIQPEVIESFNNYKSNYEYETQQMLPDDFKIEEKAVKRQNRYYKSVIKLDKNFHIYVHGDRSKIEHGEDGKGKFYKVYFDEEN